MNLGLEDIQSFERGVIRQPGCWDTCRYKDKDGYWQVGPRRRKAHRVSWALYNGPILGDLLVCHTCDNPSCTNPEHLFLGTQSDNLKDSVRKNRWGQRGCKGSKNGRAKLSEMAVRIIRRLTGTLSYQEIGKCFGVTAPTARDAAIRKTWK